MSSTAARIFQAVVNLFHASGLLQYPLKTPEKQSLSYVFRGYRKRPVAKDGLMHCKTLNLKSKTLGVLHFTITLS